MSTTELTPLNPSNDREAFRFAHQSKTNDELLALMMDGISMTEQGLWNTSQAVCMLEDRGFDFSDHCIPLLSTYRLIGDGVLLPGVVSQFAMHSLSLMNSIGALPIRDQRKLADGGSIAVVVRRSDGAFDTRMMAPKDLNASQRRQVFFGREIRDQAAQICYLEAQNLPAPAPVTRVPAKVGNVTPDPKRGGIRIGTTFVPVADALEALGSLHPGLPPDANEKVSASVGLSPIERKRLDVAAAHARISVPALIYRALMATGLLAPTDDE